MEGCPDLCMCERSVQVGFYSQGRQLVNLAYLSGSPAFESPSSAVSLGLQDLRCRGVLLGRHGNGVKLP